MTTDNNEYLITICLSYYNQNAVLVEQVNWWLQYGEELKRRISFFIIDDCSKKDALSVLRENGLEDRLNEIKVKIFRVKEDKFCNISGVRNLGATECKTRYMVILDMDTFISEKTAQQIVGIAETHKDKNRSFIFNRRVEGNIKHKKHLQLHPAVCLIRVCDYWNVGGCDEDFVGNYGYTDPTFWWRAQGVLEKHECRHIFLDYKDEGECDMSRDTSKNRRRFEKKKKSGEWSKDFLRFEYECLYGCEK